MADKTAIGWTEATWNPTTGCDQVSAGCDNCYALKMAGRLKLMGSPKYQHGGDPRTSGPGFGVTVHPSTLDQPVRWTRPRFIFVNSMSDLLHARVPVSFVTQVWGVMAQTSRHTCQVLTKRPERLTRVLAKVHQALGLEEPLPNVWVGTSIEMNEHVRRADHLRAAPAAIRFLSLEPLLGPLPSLDLTGIDWAIAGGESGPDFRPIELDWVRGIRDRCIQLGIPFFFKQIGGITPKAGGRELDGRTWDELPTGKDDPNDSRHGLPVSPCASSAGFSIQRKPIALMDRSWAPETIERVTGIPAADTTLTQILRRSFTPELAERVVTAYGPHWGQVPPRARARTQALRCGCPPLLSDDGDLIDLPDGDAERGWKRSGRTTGRSADSGAAS
jgi:protein gp37